MKKMRSLFFLATFSFVLQAQEFSDLIQFEADSYSTNLQTQKTEVSGNVHLRLGDRELYADKLSVEPSSGDVECDGKILYRQGSLEIEAKGVKFNLKTGLGVFYDAAVRRPGAFQLEGKEIERVGENVYNAKVAKISFCQDCPQSWSLVGDRVRVNTELYAEFHHAVLQIKDTPVLYLPFVYYPAVDRRFSGFLIPYFKFSTALGAQIGIPFYFAPKNNFDVTLDYRYMSRGGHRNDLQTRYVFSDRSFFKSGTSWIRAPSDVFGLSDRFGINYEGRAQFLKNWSFLAKGHQISDVDMSTHFEDDNLESRLPHLSHDLALEAQFENYALSLGVLLPQNNLQRLDSELGAVRWTLPQLKVGTPLTPLWNRFFSSFRFEELSVRRYEKSFGSSWIGKDPVSDFIVSGDRYTGLFDFSIPLNFDFLRSFSKLQYRGDLYSFGPGVDTKHASRTKLSLEQTFEGDVWKVWNTGWSDMPRLKHVVTPFVSYFFSPPDTHSNHEFFKDCPGGGCTANAPRFDLFDGGVPSEEVRLGTEEQERFLRQHSRLAYGFKTQLLGKFSSHQQIQEILFLVLQHEYDLKEDTFGRWRLFAQGKYDFLTVALQVSWSPRSARLDVLNSLSLDKKFFALSLYQNVNPSADNLGGELKLKKLGPFEFSTIQNFDRNEGKLLDQKYFISYASFSKCWKFDFGLKKRLGENDFEYSPSFQVTYSESVKNRENILNF
jgi:hypothetical protein